jgi:hypothetical protein
MTNHDNGSAQASSRDALARVGAALIPAWTIDCRRCANEGAAYDDERFESARALLERGWTAEEDGSVYCPRCSE